MCHDGADIELREGRAGRVRRVQVADFGDSVYALGMRDGLGERVLRARRVSGTCECRGKLVRTESFAGMLSANRSSSVHFLQILTTLSLESVQFKMARWFRVAWCESIKFVMRASLSVTRSDSRRVSDLRGHDQVRVRSIMVVQKAGVLFAGVGAHCVSSAR